LLSQATGELSNGNLSAFNVIVTTGNEESFPW